MLQAGHFIFHRHRFVNAQDSIAQRRKPCAQAIGRAKPFRRWNSRRGIHLRQPIDGECREPVLACVMPAEHVFQARLQVVPADCRRTFARGSSAGSAQATDRMVQARCRFKPARWTIFPSVTSLTAAGSSSRPSSPSRSPGKNPSSQAEYSGAGKYAAHEVRFRQRRGKEVLAAGFVIYGILPVGGVVGETPVDQQSLQLRVATARA